MLRVMQKEAVLNYKGRMMQSAAFTCMQCKVVLRLKGYEMQNSCRSDERLLPGSLRGKPKHNMRGEQQRPCESQITHNIKHMYQNSVQEWLSKQVRDQVITYNPVALKQDKKDAWTKKGVLPSRKYFRTPKG